MDCLLQHRVGGGLAEELPTQGLYSASTKFEGSIPSRAATSTIAVKKDQERGTGVIASSEAMLRMVRRDF